MWIVLGHCTLHYVCVLTSAAHHWRQQIWEPLKMRVNLDVPFAACVCRVKKSGGNEDGNTVRPHRFAAFYFFLSAALSHTHTHTHYIHRQLED